jgi:hypothetical protein
MRFAGIGIPARRSKKVGEVLLAAPRLVMTVSDNSRDTLPGIFFVKPRS